jgi:hypothetical protein
MRRFLIFTLISFSAIALNAQSTWAPLGAKWTYGIGYAFDAGVNYNEWIVTGDTVIDGQTCSIIERNGQEVVGDYSDNLITYEEAGVVYWRIAGAFSVLYDFNKNQGETYTLNLGECDISVIVDSTDFETINGVELKVQYVSADPPTYYVGKIMEHIGHMTRPTPDLMEICVGNPIDMNYYTELRCYEDSDFGAHIFTPFIGCDAVAVSVNEIENPFNVSLYPNPAETILNIRCDFVQEIRFNIYNSLGQKVKTGIFNADFNSIPVGDFKPGIYHLELDDKLKVQRLTFVVNP